MSGRAESNHPLSPPAASRPIDNRAGGPQVPSPRRGIVTSVGAARRLPTGGGPAPLLWRVGARAVGRAAL